MKVNIKGTEYDIRRTMTSIVIWERIMDRLFSIGTVTDLMVYYYSILLASCPDCTLQLDEFMEALSDDGVAEAFASVATSPADALMGDKKKEA